MTQLTIIILSYNTKQLTIKCIESIILQYEKQLNDGVFEIIIVDNSSTDNTVSAIRQFNNETINKIKIIKNKENYGFSKGNNIGARLAKGKYLLFLNSDTEVKNRGLAGMVTFLDNNKHVGVLGGEEAGNFYNLLSLSIMLIGGQRVGIGRFIPKKLRPVDWVSGAALMTRRQLFEKLHGFDEKFFMYVEDMELCFRAKKMGFLTFFYPDVEILHKKLGSSNREFAILNIYKGLLYFYKKNTNFIEYTVVKLLLVTKACFALAIGILTYNKYLISTYRKALILVL